MSIPIGKKYKLEKSENFDEFLKELGKNLFYGDLERLAQKDVRKKNIFFVANKFFHCNVSNYFHNLLII